MTDNNKSNREFVPIDGLRAILSFWVVGCHVCSLFIYFVYAGAPQQPERLSYLSNTWWTFLALGLGYQVDVFFMISGFLTTWNLLTKKSHFSGFAQRDIIVLLTRRLFRLWPAVIVLIIATYIIGDMHSNDWKVLLSTLTFPIDRNLPQAFGVNWSTRVDLQCTVILFGVYAVLAKANLLSLSSAVVLAFFSLVPKLWRFFTARELVSYLAVRFSPNPGDILLPVYMTVDRQNYYNDVLYPGRFDLAFVEDVGPFKQRIMKYEYLVYHQRITPFFIGLVLAFAIYKYKQNKTNVVSLVGKIMHSIYLCLSLLVVLQPLLLPMFSKSNAKKALAPGELPPIGLDLFVSVLNRPIFATGFAYILYRCMLPADHNLHTSALNSLLSHPYLTHWAKYSYGIYTIHMKVMMEIMWRVFPPKVLSAYFDKDQVFLQFVFCLFVTYLVTLLSAVIVHHAVEKPMTKHIAEPVVSYLDKHVLRRLKTITQGMREDETTKAKSE